MIIFHFKKKKLLPGLLLALTLLIFPTVVGAVPFISKETELEMGQNADPQVIAQFGLYPDKDLQIYVNQLGQDLVSSLNNPEFSDYFFKVVDSPEINAFALPGGYIYVTRGILAVMNNEAELAGVLGHEIGHVVNHHGAKQMIRSIGAQILAIGGAIASPKNAGPWLAVSTQLFTTINMGYGREAELESDAHGLMNAYEAGYEPKSAINFFRTLRQQEIMSGQSYHSFQATHPDTKIRIIKGDSLADTIVNGESKVTKKNRENFLKKIDGLIYGGKRHSKDRKQYKPEYIDIYEVKAGETFNSIAISELKDEQKDLDIAILNGMRIQDKLEPGTLLKLVRKGKPDNKQILDLKPDLARNDVKKRKRDFQFNFSD